jgi:hypothetical protein
MHPLIGVKRILRTVRIHEDAPQREKSNPCLIVEDVMRKNS